MKKILWCILFCLTITTLTVPNRVEAEENYTVYVGGVEMTASNDGTVVSYYVNGEENEKGSSTSSEPEQWNAKLFYDENNGLTLEMNGLNASGDLSYSLATKGQSGNTVDLKRCAGIYSAHKLYLIVKGENHVHGVEYDQTYNWNDETGNTVSKNLNDSYAYGIYLENGMTMGAESSGKLTVSIADANGACFGIFSKGVFSLIGGELEVIGGTPSGITDRKQYDFSTSKVYAPSYGIYSYETHIGTQAQKPKLVVSSGQAMGDTCAIYGQNGITITNGVVKATANPSKRTDYFADALKSNEAVITILDGEVEAIAPGGEGSGYNTGITANELIISGGTVKAVGGDSSGKESIGIYANYDVTITGGTVEASGGDFVASAGTGPMSYGICSYQGSVLISGKNTNVTATSGGGGTYSMGIACNRYGTNESDKGDLTIKDGAKVYASSKDDNTIRIYSYGIFVNGDFLIEGQNTYVEAVAGRVGDSNVTNWHVKKSYGVYLGYWGIYGGADENYEPDVVKEFTMTGGTLVAKSMDSDNGEINGLMNHSCALAFGQLKELAFSDSSQSDDQWYKWKKGEDTEFINSTETKYSYTGENDYDTQYLRIEPITSEELEPVYKKITFKVVNGTWADGTTADIVENVALVDENNQPDINGTGTVTIPSGMLANEGFTGGSWDKEPSAMVSGTEEEIYTYTFIEEEPKPTEKPDENEKDDSNPSNQPNTPTKDWLPDTGDKDIYLLQMISLGTVLLMLAIRKKWKKAC